MIGEVKEINTGSRDSHQVDNAALYHALGKFLVDFEFLSQRLRSTFSLLLQDDGLSTWNVGEIIATTLSRNSIDNLLQTLRAVFAEQHKEKPLSEESAKILNELFKQAIKLIEFRNELIHGEHFISHTTDNIEHITPSVLKGINRKRTASGAAIEEFEYTATEIEQKAQDCRSIAMLIMHFHLSTSPRHTKDYNPRESEVNEATLKQLGIIA